MALAVDVRHPGAANTIDIIVSSDDDVLMRYPGGKGKCYQRLINLMPPHEVYVEAFLGGGAVLRHKRPALHSIGIERDPYVATRWRELASPGLELVEGDAMEFLASYPFKGDEFVYLDPPYMASTRRRARVYRHDFSDADHERLLRLAVTLPCRVMISGYANPKYDQTLTGWRRFTFQAKAHDGVREESVWINYPPPAVLHDARFCGSTFRERQTIKRRRERLRTKIAKLPAVERAELLTWLQTNFQPSGDTPCSAHA